MVLRSLISMSLVKSGNKMTKKKYWYKFWHQECPVCGGGQTFKERQYTKKPKDIFKRHIHEQAYDHCIERGNICHL